MKPTKGVIDLKMRDGSTQSVKCFWIDCVAIHKISSRTYTISHRNGLRILRLDGMLYRDIVPLVIESLCKCKVDSIDTTFKHWSDQDNFMKAFGHIFVKGYRK